MKSVVLFVIGTVLLVISVNMNAELDKRYWLDIERADALMQLDRAIRNRGGGSGNSDSTPVPVKGDQTGVYAVGCIGAIFILGGIITIGRSGRRR